MRSRGVTGGVTLWGMTGAPATEGTGYRTTMPRMIDLAGTAKRWGRWPDVLMATLAFMARDTVLVIGAGASYGARPKPRKLQPPLGKDLARYLLRWFDRNRPRDGDVMHSHYARDGYEATSPPPPTLYQRGPDIRPILLKAVALSKTSPTGFEALMEQLLVAGDRDTLTKLNSVIALSLLLGEGCAFMPREDLYDKLFTKLGPRLRCVITPNYDLLNVEALVRRGLTFRFVGEAGRKRTDVLLYRFHGSSNYFQPSGAGRSASPEAAQKSAKPLRAKRQKNILSFFNDHPLAAPFPRYNAIFEHKRAYMTPVLVTYGPGKDATDGRQYLDKIRRACRENIRRSSPARIIALGVSPPRGGGDDDAWEGLCKVFKSLDCAKEYWSKDQTERRKMVRFGFRGRDGYFDELLAALGRDAAGE